MQSEIPRPGASSGQPSTESPRRVQVFPGCVPGVGTPTNYARAPFAAPGAGQLSVARLLQLARQAAQEDDDALDGRDLRRFGMSTGDPGNRYARPGRATSSKRCARKTGLDRLSARFLHGLTGKEARAFRDITQKMLRNADGPIKQL